MMDQVSLQAALTVIPGSTGEWRVEQVGERTFHARNLGQDFFVKWIDAGDQRGRNEMEVNTSILPGTSISTPRLVRIIPSGKDSLIIWEWVEGQDLRSDHREFLVDAFRQMGRFHHSRRNEGEVFSPITENVYPSIPSFLDGESRLLCADLSSAMKKGCDDLLQRLSIGYSTIIHGDLHPGNLIATAKGIYFVDWGYSRRSINLLDLDYISSLNVKPLETDWWIIQPEESGEVLAGYYSTCGMTDANPAQIQHAVMLWSELWKLYNSRKTANQPAYATSMCRLEQLLEVRT